MSRLDHSLSLNLEVTKNKKHPEWQVWGWMQACLQMIILDVWPPWEGFVASQGSGIHVSLWCLYYWRPAQPSSTWALRVSKAHIGRPGQTLTWEPWLKHVISFQGWITSEPPSHTAGCFSLCRSITAQWLRLGSFFLGMESSFSFISFMTLNRLLNLSVLQCSYL